MWRRCYPLHEFLLEKEPVNLNALHAAETFLFDLHSLYSAIQWTVWYSKKD